MPHQQTEVFRPQPDNQRQPSLVPLFTDRFAAGFPSPAQDYIERALDLHELCVQRPASTFFIRASGTSMVEAGIFPGDILVVNRSLQARHGDVVIALHHGEFLVKALELHPQPRLVARSAGHGPIDIPEGSEVEIWGVVMHVVHTLRGS